METINMEEAIVEMVLLAKTMVFQTQMNTSVSRMILFGTV